MTQAEVSPSGPVVCPLQHVDAGWIDYNGHLNMAYYHVLFDRALDHVYHQLGIDEGYLTAGAGSCFTMEVHVNYLRELVAGDPVRVDFQLLDFDAKRLHFFEHMYHADQGYLAATSEQLAMHVDMRSRRSAPFPGDVTRRLERLYEQHRGLERPEQVGRIIGIRRKP